MLPDDAAPALALQDYIRTLRRRKGVVVLSVILMLATALAYSWLQTPSYASVAKLLLKPSGQQVFGTDSQPVELSRSVDTEIEVIKTEPVQELVRGKIGSAPAVTVGAVGETELITIRATSTQPQRAAEIANAYANAYIDFRRKQALDELSASSEQIQTKITQLQSQIDEYGSQLDGAPVCVDTRTTGPACAQRATIEQTVGVRRTTLLNQQALFRQRLDQLQVNQALATGGAQLVTPAYASSEPFEPTPRRNAALGVVLGLIFGVGLAFVLEHLDDSIKSKDDIESSVAGTSVLGLIPAISDWKAKDRARIVSLSDPTSPAAEAYRTLRTSIQFLGLDRDVKLVQITSASAQEGKSTTLSNLAVAFANSGLRTVAVCCDLRRPRLHEFFGLTNTTGFTSVLLGSVPLSKALQPVPGVDRLLFLASGPVPPNPSELLSSPRTADLFRNIASQADIVLIDSPPVLPVTDALVLSQRVDSTVIVTSVGTTTKKAAARTAEMLHQVKAPLVGLVLNGVTEESGYGYGYGSRYYAASSAQAPDAEMVTNGNGHGAENGAARKVGRRQARSEGKRATES